MTTFRKLLYGVTISAALTFLACWSGMLVLMFLVVMAMILASICALVATNDLGWP
jgi:hypothetical protein